MELEVDKVELLQWDQCVSEDKKDKEEDATEEGEEVKVEQELLELMKGREEHRDESEKEEEGVEKGEE